MGDINMDSTLENYEIVQYLKEHSSWLYDRCKSLYGICKRLLGLIPSTCENYTLHDIDHSRRVSGYMNDLGKSHLDDFSCLHLAIMVFVGLLHDTGMVVTANEKAELYKEFTERKAGFEELSDEEKLSYLQKYIRDSHGSRVGKTINESINPDMNIKGLLYVGDENSYDISDIVVDICTAHNEDSQWIVDHLDDDRVFGKDKINPRHIAVLLRIGDSLDIDDRRAPYMLYHLLKVKGYSDGEWRKHIPITNYNKIEEKSGSYSISFYIDCDDPDIFRKVIEYIDSIDEWIAKDIALCTDEYKISLKLPIKRRIKTNGFDSKPLQFTLDYKQITRLLMGEKIYGSRKQGLRELVQNAIDAVMVMKDIKGKSSPVSYVPTVGIEIKQGENQITVYDNGIGMTEEVLDKFFFSIGKSFYESDEYDLSEHSYSPIGHFGIGFLACFMLSSSIILETKHYSEGAESIRMSFDKESQHIIKYKSSAKKPIKLEFEHGTKIIMNYDQIIPNVFPDVNNIEEYIKELLLDNHFEFVLSNPPEKKKLELYKTRFIYKDEEHKEEVYFDYTTGPIHGGFLLDVGSFFGKEKLDMYVVDRNIGLNDTELSITGIDCILSEAEAFEAYYQTEGRDLDKTIEEHMDDFVITFFLQLVANETRAIRLYGETHKEIYGFFLDYLSSYISGNELIWYEIPCIIDSDTFSDFVNKYEKDGFEKAIEEYKGQIINGYILCKDGEPDAASVLEVMKRIIDIHADRYDRRVIDIDYYDEYPIKPIRRSVKILKNDDSHNFIAIEQQDKDIGLRTFLKGILVPDRTITLPYTIKGIDIKSVIIDLKSGRYGLDISRNSFDANVKEDIEKNIACAIYGDLMKSPSLSQEEKELIAKFLQVYYGGKS